MSDSETGASRALKTRRMNQFLRALAVRARIEFVDTERDRSMPGQPRDFIARRYKREGLDPLSGGQEGFGAIMPSSNLLRNNSPRLLVNLSC